MMNWPIKYFLGAPAWVSETRTPSSGDPDSNDRQVWRPEGINRCSDVGADLSQSVK